MDKKFSVREIALCGLFTGLITIGAWIRIPVPVVPFTLQFLFTMLAGLLLGKRLGAWSVLVYIVLGLAGMPIFSEGGGISYVLQPSFGYLPGFCLGAWYVGWQTEDKAACTMKHLLFTNFTGLGIVYLCGMVYYYIIANFVIGTPIAVGPLLLYCFVLAVPGDIFLCFLAAGLAKQCIPVVRAAEV